MSKRHVIYEEDPKKVVLNYTPKKIPVVVSKQTSDFISSQENTSSDFLMSEAVSEQIGITELKKKNMAEVLEDKLLEDLKGIEEKAYKEAYDLGLIEGEKKAYEENLENINKRLMILDEFIQNTQSLYRKLFDKNEALILKVIYSFASKIAMLEIKNRPEELVNIVKQTIDTIQGDIKAHVFISEEDKSFLDEIKKNVKKEFEFINNIEIDTSQEVSQGGCLIETNYGVIDASIEQRIDKVWQSINEKLPKGDEDNIKNE